MWEPSTVEDIRKWLAGEYVPNPTNEEYRKQLLERIKRMSTGRQSH
jgi:hypothetical protein